MLGGEDKQGIGEEWVVRSYHDQSFPAQLLFLLFVEPVLRHFCASFRVKDHWFTYYVMPCVRQKDKKPDKQLSISEMEVGEKTLSSLSKLSTEQQQKVL